MEQVIQRFGLREPHYFGLLFAVDQSTYSWLEADKSLSHQLKGMQTQIISCWKCQFILVSCQ